MTRSAVDLVVTLGLAAGAIFGIAGSVVPDAELRQLCWLIDGVGVVIATTLIAIRCLRAGQDLVAGGFLVFAMGECLLVGSASAGLTESIPAFGGGVALWSAGLLLISLPALFPGWVRVVGVLAALLFCAVSVGIALGQPLTPIARPLPFFGYPFVVAAFVGWTLYQRRVTEPRTVRQP